MDMRVDEARQDQMTGMMLDRRAGRQRGQQLGGRSDRGNLAVDDADQPIVVVGGRGVIAQQASADRLAGRELAQRGSPG
jgi:hypothetical protein